MHIHILENKMPTTKKQRREKEETMTIRALDQTKENIRRTTTTAGLLQYYSQYKMSILL
jgi:hypothetical protein